MKMYCMPKAGGESASEDPYGAFLYRSHDGTTPATTIQWYAMGSLVLSFRRGADRYVWAMHKSTLLAFVAALHDVGALQPGETLVWRHIVHEFNARREPLGYEVQFRQMSWSYTFDVEQMRDFVVSLEKVAEVLPDMPWRP